MKHENNVDQPLEVDPLHSRLVTKDNGTVETKRAPSDPNIWYAADFGVSESVMPERLRFLFSLDDEILEEIEKLRSMSNYSPIPDDILSDYSKRTRCLFRILVGTYCGELLEDILRTQGPEAVTPLSQALIAQSKNRLAQCRAVDHCDWVGAGADSAGESKRATKPRLILPSHRKRRRKTEEQQQERRQQMSQQRRVRQPTRHVQPNTDTRGVASLPSGGGGDGAHHNSNTHVSEGENNETIAGLDGCDTAIDDSPSDEVTTAAAPGAAPATAVVATLEATPSPTTMTPLAALVQVACNQTTSTAANRKAPPTPTPPTDTSNQLRKTTVPNPQHNTDTTENRAVSVLPDGRKPTRENEDEPWQYVAEHKGLACAAYVLSNIPHKGRCTGHAKDNHNNPSSIIQTCTVHASECDSCMLEPSEVRSAPHILPSDLTRLDNQGWFNDTILSTSIDLVRKYYASNTGRVHFLSVYWFTQMFKKDPNDKTLRLNDWTFLAGGGGQASPPTRSNRLSVRDAYNAHRLLFIPVNEPRSHWIWILVVKETKQILVCDPVDCKDASRDSQLLFYGRCVATRLRNELRRSRCNDELGLVSGSVPKFVVKNLFREHQFQTDASSCGVFMVWAAWAVIKDRRPVQDFPKLHLADIQAATISWRGGTVGSRRMKDSIRFFRLWLCVSILRNKLWIPDDSPTALRLVNESKEKVLQCIVCSDDIPESKWEKMKPVSLGCGHYACRVCVIKFHSRPMVGNCKRDPVIPCKQCPGCKRMNIWKDVLTDTPYPPKRWFGFVLMGTNGRKTQNRFCNPFYVPITDLEEWNGLAECYSQADWAIPIPTSGLLSCPEVVDDDSKEQVHEVVDDKCVWCGAPGNLKNTICGHYGCDRCYQNLVEQCQLKWLSSEPDVRLVRVGACSICQKHPGCWVYVDGEGAPRAPPQPVFGYLRTHVGTTMSEVGTLRTKPIRVESEWNQLCLHFGLYHWMTKAVRWDGGVQDSAIEIDGVPTNPQDLKKPDLDPPYSSDAGTN